jgi:hypothetical protein
MYVKKKLRMNERTNGVGTGYYLSTQSRIPSKSYGMKYGTVG